MRGVRIDPVALVVEHARAPRRSSSRYSTRRRRHRTTGRLRPAPRGPRTRSPCPPGARSWAGTGPRGRRRGPRRRVRRRAARPVPRRGRGGRGTRGTPGGRLRPRRHGAPRARAHGRARSERGTTPRPPRHGRPRRPRPRAPTQRRQVVAPDGVDGVSGPGSTSVRSTVESPDCSSASTRGHRQVGGGPDRCDRPRRAGWDGRPARIDLGVAHRHPRRARSTATWSGRAPAGRPAWPTIPARGGRPRAVGSPSGGHGHAG